MIKAVFFDIDGTLTAFGTTIIPEDTRLALRLLKEKGIRIFVATGRYLPDLNIVTRENLDFDGYVILNGQACVDQNLNIIYEYDLSKDIDALVELFNQREVSLVMTEFEHKYTNTSNGRAQKFRDKLNFPPLEVSEYKGNPIYQVSAYVNDEEASALISNLPNCRFVRWNEIGVDIIPADGGKTKGIEKMCEHFGIDISETMAFGDSGNDQDMIEFAHIGVAMGNGSEAVKAAADYVTKNSDDGGILHALRHFHII